MKIVCILLFTLSTMFTGAKEEKNILEQETKTVLATFVSTKDGGMIFKEGLQFKVDNSLKLFYVEEPELAKTVENKFSFSNSTNKGKQFNIVYKPFVSKLESGNDIVLNIIVSIEMVDNKY